MGSRMIAYLIMQNVCEFRRSRRDLRSLLCFLSLRVWFTSHYLNFPLRFDNECDLVRIAKRFHDGLRY